MRFYYVSIFSLMLLGVIYLTGTGLLVWFWVWLRQRWKNAWLVMVPLFLLLYLAPIAEELWIAWNFGQQCRKDAGRFIYKTVEVEGFYDATRERLPGPVSEQAADYLDKGGYRFYEMVLPNHTGGPNQVVHLEKVNGDWKATVLDHPTGRYHFYMDSGIQITHGVWSQTSSVVDKHSGDLLARYTRYDREAPWFFISLGRPRIACDGPDGGPNTKYNFLIYRDVLKPTTACGGDKE